MRELIVKGSGCRLVPPNKEWNKHGFNSEETFEAVYQDFQLILILLFDFKIVFCKMSDRKGFFF